MTGLVWFFGYGSLMWRTGFAPDAFEWAELEGWHRALCIYSYHYRGTHARPGLVLGLAPGGRCVGRAIGVRVERGPEVLAYLDERELLTDYVYERREVPLRLVEHGQTVDAWAYVSIPDHPHFAGGLAREETLRLVRQGVGLAGSNLDYLGNTVAHLQAMAIAEPELEALADALGPAER